MGLTVEEAREKYPGVIFAGRVWIEQGALIERGAWILTICSKYTCNIIPFKNKPPKIRIACESHTIEEWEKVKEELADHHDREWWDKTGERIYEFLKGEVAAYVRSK